MNYTHRKSDRLVAVVKEHRREASFIRAKRVGKDCPLTWEERMAYVNHGPVRACKQIMDSRKVSLAEAYALLNKTRH